MERGFPIRPSHMDEARVADATTAMLPNGPQSDEPTSGDAPAKVPPAEPAAPVKKPSPYVTHYVTATIASFLGLGGLFVIEYIMRVMHIMPDPMLGVGSFAAVATLMYAAPAAPLGKPLNLFYGHFLSIVVALLVFHACEAMGWPWQLQVATGVSLSIGLMVQQKVPHPPAAACAFIFLQFTRAHTQPLFGMLYMLFPALVGCAWMLFVQRAVHFCADYIFDAVQARKARRDANRSDQPDGASYNGAHVTPSTSSFDSGIKVTGSEEQSQPPHPPTRSSDLV